MNGSFASNVLERTASLLDITPAQQEAAVTRYEDLGNWLLANQRGRADVDIYPQGSFRLGTVVRPADGGGDFDIDMVFLRDLEKASVTQEALKTQAGDLLVAYCDERNLGEPVELGRCWRLEFFDDHFHLDVLPVIPDREVEGGVHLSDRDLALWLKSNPIGYANWFYDRMDKTLVEAQLASLAKALGRSMEEVPRFLVRTPLQRVVQLFKRSRDEFFVNEPDIKPASILVTTLAGHAYRGQRDLDRALIETAESMPQYVESRSGLWWVENPAHSGENFADKWNSNPERKEAFFSWLETVAKSARVATRTASAHEAGDALSPTFGSLAAEAGQVVAGKGPTSRFKAARGDARAPREQYIEEMFTMDLRYKVSVSCDVADPAAPNRYYRRRAAHQRRLQKLRSLRFEVTGTSAPEPYDVYWKVRNYGREAMLKGELRGEITRDAGRRMREERTAYQGDHYVEGYIVKDGRCVARTREWVPIE